MQQAAPPPVLLPHGWVSATDPVSGRIYYANPSTGQTSWEPPLPPQLVPPPPPPQPQPFNEVQSLSAGKIADMCHLQQTQTNYEPYRPLEPYLMVAQPPHAEEARLEIRIATLYDQLKRQS